LKFINTQRFVIKSLSTRHLQGCLPIFNCSCITNDSSSRVNGKCVFSLTRTAFRGMKGGACVENNKRK